MNRRTGSLVAAILAIAAAPTTAQWLNYPTPNVPRTRDGKPNLSAACPRTADGKPDLSGVWHVPAPPRTAPANLPGCEPVAPEFINIGASIEGGLPYQSWAAQLVRTRQAEQRIHDPLSHCLPTGIVRTNVFPGFRKIIQVPGLMVILSEYNASYRQIFTDARPLPVDPNQSWNGYSSGKWEGDTLVVQTAGFQDGKIWLDAAGNPLTDAAKITERFRRLDFGHLEIELTVDDSKAYTKPWTIKLNQIITLDTELLDYICNENEKDIRHLVPK